MSTVDVDVDGRQGYASGMMPAPTALFSSTRCAAFALWAAMICAATPPASILAQRRATAPVDSRALRRLAVCFSVYQRSPADGVRGDPGANRSMLEFLRAAGEAPAPDRRTIRLARCTAVDAASLVGLTNRDALQTAACLTGPRAAADPQRLKDLCIALAIARSRDSSGGSLSASVDVPVPGVRLRMLGARASGDSLSSLEALRMRGPALAGCRDSAGRGIVDLVFSSSAEGTLVEAFGVGATPDSLTACVSAVAAEIRADGRAGQVTVVRVHLETLARVEMGASGLGATATP